MAVPSAKLQQLVESEERERNVRLEKLRNALIDCGQVQSFKTLVDYGVESIAYLTGKPTAYLTPKL